MTLKRISKTIASVGRALVGGWRGDIAAKEDEVIRITCLLVREESYLSSLNGPAKSPPSSSGSRSGPCSRQDSTLSG
jgi:hypothetical protein